MDTIKIERKINGWKVTYTVPESGRKVWAIYKTITEARMIARALSDGELRISDPN